MTLDAIPDVLYGAAFVSSEGRAYRLFANDDRPSLGGTFRLDSPQFSSTSPEDEREPRLWKVTKDNPPDIDDDGPPPSTLPIGEAIRRSRAVEGTWSRHTMGPAIRLLDTMVQSATDKSMRVLSSCQTSKRDAQAKTGKTDTLPEEPTLRIFSIASEQPSIASRETNTAVFERKTVAAPLCREIMVGGKPIFLGERNVNLTSEIRQVDVCATDIPPGVFEQNTGQKHAPFFIEKTKTRPSVNRYSNVKVGTLVEPTRPMYLEVLFNDDQSPQTQLNVEHWEVDPRDAVIVSETKVMPHKAGLTTLTQLAFSTTRRRKGFVPRRLPPRYQQVKREEVTEQLKTTTVLTSSNEVEPGDTILKTVPDARETVAETADVPEMVESLFPAEEHRLTVQEKAKPRRVPFHWPPKSETVKAKAARQIGSLTDRLLGLREQGRTRICFHSFFPTEGCSTMLICAVRELMERGLRVLLADANCHHPMLPELLGIELMSDSAERLTLIDGSLELLSWGKWVKENDETPTLNQSTYIGRLQEGYDFVLIDGGSLTEGVPEEKTIFWRETETDGVILVVNAMAHRPLNLEAVDRNIRKHGVELLGVMENYVK